MKYLKIIIFALICFTLSLTVKASELKDLDVNVYIDENGNGYVTETWKLDAEEGTENYHAFANLENRNITDYKVSMDGKNYTYIDTWNVNASKSEKAYKNGINYTENGLELCHGIEYGIHTYTITYTIENLVWQYEDNQILYFTFLPQNMKQAPNHYKITIEGDSEFTNLKYSSYGFKSNNSIQNGKVILESKGNMKSSEYVVALIGFPNNTFTNLSVTQTGTYNSVVDKALEGATLNKDISVITILLWILGGGILILIIVFIILKSDKYDEKNCVIPKKVNYFRDIPFNKDIMAAYFMGIRKGYMKKENLIGSFLLKWLNEGKIAMNSKGEKGIIIKKDDYDIDLTNLINITEKTEQELATFLINVSENNILEPNKFKKWCRNNYTIVENWMEKANYNSREILINNGYIIEEKSNSKLKGNKYILTEKLRDETIKLKGLKGFLNDMTLMNEKKAIEIKLWNEYLVFAQSFGIADKVAKQLKEFKPDEYVTNSTYYDNALWIGSFGYESAHAAIEARNAASSGGSFSGGGTSSGGFSSGGGGVR